MRQKFGMVFLLLTIGALVTAVQNGGFWWLAVAVSSALTLWGIGFTKDSVGKKKD